MVVTNMRPELETQEVQEYCPHCSRPLCPPPAASPGHRPNLLMRLRDEVEMLVEEEEEEVEAGWSLAKGDTGEVDSKLDKGPTCERFMFSFYVKIDRDQSEEVNMAHLELQLEKLVEIEQINLLYFKKYFSRLQFNEVVVDFETRNSVEWRKAPQQILRNVNGYNAAYKFSQLKIENKSIV